MKKSHRISGIILIALILTVATFAFAAANTMPTVTEAGDGATGISGYEITNVKYNLDASDPSMIDTVTFTIDPATASTVRIKLVATSTTWYTCTVAGANVTCDLPGTGLAAATADNLRVVATN